MRQAKRQADFHECGMPFNDLAVMSEVEALKTTGDWRAGMFGACDGVHGEELEQ